MNNHYSAKKVVQVLEYVWQSGKESIFFSEKRCTLCGGVFSSYVAGSSHGGQSNYFCPVCLNKLHRRDRGFCPLCGDIFAWPELPLTPCRFCIEKKPAYQGVLFYGVHEGLLRKALLQIKFFNNVAVAHALGSLLVTHPRFSDLKVDLILPLPLHRKRLQERGFNQSVELARPMVAKLGASLEVKGLERTKNTISQTGLSRKERHENTKDAFFASKRVAGKDILLVDDVMTTGATMNAAASALLEAGALHVYAAVMSRAPSSYFSNRRVLS